MNLNDLFVISQYLTPQHLLSRMIGKLAESEFTPLKNKAIELFSARYQVDMSEAAIQDIDEFRNFNDFFTRELKPGARTIEQDSTTIISPVDGTISQLGPISQGQIFQAKGQRYSVVELLGGDHERALPFIGGDFATIYLAPRDYHRIHMPFNGILSEMVYVPGKLFSVNPVTAEKVPRLFARNERVVALFDTDIGPMAVVLVGAMIVASIETVWAGQVAPVRRAIHTTQYGKNLSPISLAKGEELGRFKLGSTVILAFPPDTVEFVNTLKSESCVTMGQAFACVK